MEFAALVQDGTIPAAQVPDIVAALDSEYAELIAAAMIADAIALKLPRP